ncbi:MAG: hypothetical protein Devi2KO_29440 [Devosia indica]
MHVNVRGMPLAGHSKALGGLSVPKRIELLMLKTMPPGQSDEKWAKATDWTFGWWGTSWA